MSEVEMPAVTADPYLPIRVMSEEEYLAEQQDTSRKTYVLQRAAVARKLGCTHSTLDRILKDPRFPRPIKLPGSDRPLFFEREIDQYLKTLRSEG